MSGNSLPRLGDYLLIERVGEGGMAEVFRAQYSGDEHSVGPQSVVVVKRIKPELFTKPEFPIFREMFLNEAKLVRSLQHPNLARVYALLEATDPELGQKVPFIVQEYVRGQQLWELLRIATRGFTGLGVPPGIATFICREMARGLGHAHTHKDATSGKLQPIIHRDISPENVMVSAEGQIKVIDFGVAKALGGFGPQTRTGIIKGKLAYMAPEQVAQKVVPATDVFGAGIVLHEMLTGRRLFGGHNDFMVISRVLKAEIPRPSQLQNGIPKELDDVVMTALSRDLKTRYLDGNAFADALTRVMAKLPEMRGITTTTLKQWSKQVVAEGVKISSNWGEEESGVHVEVDVSDAMRRVEEGSGDDIIELTADDLMRAELDGSFDPGVRAAVTMGLKTLRPDMLTRPAGSEGGNSGFSAALPGMGRANAARPAAVEVAAPVVVVAPTASSNPPVRPTPAPNMGSPAVRQTPPPETSNAPVRQTPPPNAGNAPVRPTPPPNVGNAPVRLTPPPNVGNAPVRLTPPPNVGNPIVDIGLNAGGGARPVSSHLAQVSSAPSSGSYAAGNAPSANSTSGSLDASRISNPSGISNPSSISSVSRSSNPSGISNSSANSNPSGISNPSGLGSFTPPGVTPAGVYVPRTLGPASAESAGFSPAVLVGGYRPIVEPSAELPRPADVHPAFFDKQVERWVKFIAALVALAFVLVVLLLLRD